MATQSCQNECLVHPYVFAQQLWSTAKDRTHEFDEKYHAFAHALQAIRWHLQSLRYPHSQRWSDLDHEVWNNHLLDWTPHKGKCGELKREKFALKQNILH